MAVIRKRVKLYPRFIELYESGMSDYEIASELVCASSTVMRWRKDNGLPANCSHHRRSLLKPHAEQIKALRESGATYDQIASQVGASGDGVRKFCCKMGIST